MPLLLMGTESPFSNNLCLVEHNSSEANRY